jgi:hypothetical protein
MPEDITVDGDKFDAVLRRMLKGTRIKLVVQAQSQPDNIATLPLLTATFVRPVRPVARGTETETLAA